MFSDLSQTLAFIIESTKLHAYVLGYMLAIIWGVFLLTKLSGNRLLILGIIPRKAVGIPGIVCSPFLHANFNHIFFNTIPLVILGNFVLLYSTQFFLIASLSIILISGVLTWLFAKPGIHVGASAVITGYWGLLVTDIYNLGGTMTVLLGIVCIYYFAGIFLGVFPGKKGVSWEGHLFGLIAGITTSFII